MACRDFPSELPLFTLAPLAKLLTQPSPRRGIVHWWASACSFCSCPLVGEAAVATLSVPTGTQPSLWASTPRIRLPQLLGKVI